MIVDTPTVITEKVYAINLTLTKIMAGVAAMKACLNFCNGFCSDTWSYGRISARYICRIEFTPVDGVTTSSFKCDEVITSTEKFVEAIFNSLINK
ncbi:unnamed protein product [Rotaria socialis]|uniref:Uncharacterized protein n=1 Tax=Rotaria socialis TaxID=392032 RepID=A0A818G0N9_9BILA|nr:unnamed protein product [Rotaria socialis]